MGEQIKGTRNREQAIQLPLEKEGQKELYRFKAGVWIYPWKQYGRGGTIEEDIVAERANHKSKGLKYLYTLKNPCRFYHYRSQHYYTLPAGTLFQAYSSKAKKI